MDVSELSEVGLESPKKLLAFNLPILSRRIYMRDEILLLVLTPNTAESFFVGEHSPLFL